VGVSSSKLILITPGEDGQLAMVCQSIFTPTRANILEAIAVTPPLEIEATSLMQTVTLRAAAAPVSAPHAPAAAAVIATTAASLTFLTSAGAGGRGR